LTAPWTSMVAWAVVGGVLLLVNGARVDIAELTPDRVPAMINP
jgi:hypothetical protein